MVQSIELLLDPESEATVRATWDLLAAAGLPSLADHRGVSNRPHLTLLAAESGLEGSMSQLRELLEQVDLPAVLGAPLLFGGHRGRWVLTRQVVPSRALLALHAAVHQVVEAATGASRDTHSVDPHSVDPHSEPDAWTPHVSLARRMPADRLPQALALLDPQPLACRLVGARLWDSPSATVMTLDRPDGRPRPESRP
ncbi:2'-5' RNA ligase family protein [uncultured Amnibacterium sp.]|uniref:2'-5' RNA ligase family protein n=1 Tax=uncultured Amnibacterium sp. TaxID=1631851 RepID=UPI0035CAE694